MSRFPGKKLPPHWIYLPSRREVRCLIRDLAADMRGVQFDGTGRGASPVGLLLGYLERRVAEGKWCFFLRLWGAPESVVGQCRVELARSALQAIRESIVECLARPPTEVVKPTQLLLWFSIEGEKVVSKCRVKPVDRYCFSTGRWWENPKAAETDAAADRPRE